MEVKVIKSKKFWENFLLREEQRNFLQSWYWGETQKLLGRKIFRFGFFNHSKVCGVCLLIKQEAKRGNYLECPGGPIIDWSIKNFQIFVDLVKKIGKKEKCSFVRVRPPILNTQENQKIFQEAKFIKAPMHLHAQDTWLLALDKSETELLKGMRKTTRYLIKKAKKEGVRVVVSKNQKDINFLYQLQKETSQRHGFIPFSLAFFKAHFKAFQKDNKIKIFKAILGKKILACALIIFWGGRAVYHYAASSKLATKIPASYLLQWEAIKKAKKEGCKIYDFWGIAPPHAAKNHRFAGVTLFKQGFGGFPISYLPAQDLPLRWNYYLIYLFETLRRKWRHL